MSKGYAIYLAKNNRNLQVVEFPIQPYAQSQQLFRFMNEHKDGVITCDDLKSAGFEDITREWMYPTRPMGQSGCGKDAPGNLAHYMVEHTTMHAWPMSAGRFDIGSLDTYYEAVENYGK